MPQFINFYENVAEARLRLLNTVVAYEGHPCYVHWISDSHEDGRFRIYIEQIGVNGYGIGRDKFFDFPSRDNHYENSYDQVLDEWLERNPDRGVMRKYMSSQGFNKYRPFPLGNVNMSGQVVYTERRPTRQTIQGIRQDSLVSETVQAAPRVEPDNGLRLSRVHVDLYSEPFADCVLGNYPSYEEVIEHLKSPDCGNAGLAFSRDFSVLRGPLKTLFLCYKTEGVGCIGIGSGLILDTSYEYLKEQVEELNVFPYINLG